MARLWLVARHEYVTMVGKRSFLFGTLAVPLVIVLATGIAILFATGNRDSRPIGYVDRSGLLVPDAAKASGGQRDAVAMRPFSGEEEARQALQEGEIQAYYVLPADLRDSRSVALVYWDDPPSEVAQDQFARFIRASAVRGLPPQVQERALAGSSLVVRSANGQRELDQGNWLSFVLPMVAGVLFMIAVMSSAGYLLRAVTTEKENRTIEIMITSLTPEELIAGKALGLMGVALTQLLIWALAAGIAVFVLVQNLQSVSLGRVPWSMIAVTLAYFIPAYALVGGLMTLIGSAVTETRQGQQIASVLNILFMAPFFLTALILAEPNSPLMVVLTLFPATAFLTVVLRWSVTIVPWWQLAAAWLLLAGSAAFSVWSAARVLRVGMLRYGQRLDLRAVVRAIRSPAR